MLGLVRVTGLGLFLFNQLLQFFAPEPLVCWLISQLFWGFNFLNKTQTFENIDYIIKSPYFRLLYMLICLAQNNLGSLFKSQILFALGEKFQKLSRQRFQRFFLPISFHFLTPNLSTPTFPKLPNSFHSFSESFPFIDILPDLADDGQTLHYVDDIIDPSSFHIELACYLIKHQNVRRCSFEFLYKFAGQFHQTFVLPVVTQDFVLDVAGFGVGFRFRAA